MTTNPSRKLVTLALIAAAGLLSATAIGPASARAEEPMQVITDPDTVVLGQTISQWTADYIR